jgi:adenine phosphoribosyltransferase
MKTYESLIRTVPDFPKPGILFKDITPMVGDAKALAEVTDDLFEAFRSSEATHIVGIESRGFIFGSLLAYRMGTGFVPVRKPGKLPAETISASYNLEYGQNTLHIHKDALPKGSRVVIIDDLLATGGTLHAACDLVKSLGASIAGIGVVIELSFLNGRGPLAGIPFVSLIQYHGE